IVVPSFAKSQHGDEEVVGRIVIRGETLRTPDVGRRVHQPRGMQPNYGAKEYRPESDVPSPDCEDRYTDHHLRDPVIAAEPNLNFVFTKIRDVGRKFRG